MRSRLILIVLTLLILYYIVNMSFNLLVYYTLFKSIFIPETDYANLFIYIVCGVSLIIYGEGIVSFILLRRSLNSQQFFLISSIYFTSLVPIALLFVRIFQQNIERNNLIAMGKLFNFFYFEVVFLFILSIITINIKYNKDGLLFLFISGVSAFIAQRAPLGFFKTSSIFQIFFGGGYLFLTIGFVIGLIAIGIYLIDLLNINMRHSVIIVQIWRLLGFWISFHGLILSSESIIFLPIFSIFLILSIFGYLRGVFIYSL